jgi:hypothetical protein
VGLLAALVEHAGSLTQLAVGALSGIIASSVLIAAGLVPSRSAAPPPPSPLALVRCPGSGSVVTVAQPGEQMLVTGRSADGAWFRIYVPGPASSEGWVRAGSIELLADDSALPLESCGEVASASGSPGPTATPVIASASPSIAPTSTPAATPAAATPTATPSTAAAPTPNVGPVFRTQPAANRTTIAFKPFGSGNCATSTTVTTAASDPDGIAEIQLWVKKPGAASFAKLSHDFVRAGSAWSNSIDSAKDGIAAAGTLSFYGVAIDSKGASTTSKVKSIKVVRCDTEASINGSIDFPQNSDGQYEIFCVIRWKFLINDPDGVAGVTLTYTIPPGAAAPYGTIKMKLAAGSQNIWTGQTTFVPSGVSTVAWTVTSTDAFGGTTALSRTDVVHYSCVK